MKIIIIGAGIASFSTYAFLARELPSDTEIIIYEAHNDTRTLTKLIGGGLGLHINGLLILKSLLAPEAYKAFKAKGFQSWKSTMRNSKGTTLGAFSFGKREMYGEENIMMPRADVHEAVKTLVPEGAVRYGMRCKNVWEEDGKVKVEFQNGDIENADVIIGGDGVRSVVKTVIAKDFECNTEAVYTELTGMGGFLPMDKVPETIRNTLKEDPIVMTFGGSGFFGYSPARPFKDGEPHDLFMWWSTAECKGAPPPRNTPITELREQLLKRHADWKDSSGNATFTDLIKSTMDGNSQVLVLPEYETPRLPSYASKSGRVFLVGDAAHAMPPHAGQGVSTALEDGKALALILKHHLTEHDAPDFVKLGQQYTKIRKPRIDRILDVAARKGDTKRELGWIGELIRDVFIWIMCRFMGEGLASEVVRHDIEAEIKKVLN